MELSEKIPTISVVRIVFISFFILIGMLKFMIYFFCKRYTAFCLNLTHALFLPSSDVSQFKNSCDKST